MKYIADLHIHSPFSRATSKASNLAGLAAWARIKGIQVLGTGDFTHPGWFRQIKESLTVAEPGFFKLKSECGSQVRDVLAALDIGQPSFADEAAESRFVLTAEISSIYKRGDRVRKVHNILFVPDFESAERINTRLAGLGNIESDGRPILGLDSRNLLEIVLELAPEGFLVPAHIWTPWFSLFGSKSGFDAIEECFGDLTPHVFALETGLSSDPDMNRRISALDRFALISNSDCHSPAKLGREANIFQADFNFFALRDALKGNNKETFPGTIEFYPEEGKYHYDGHRKCSVCLDPAETRRLDGICPACGRPLTIGVSSRVLELADREKPFYHEKSPGFFSLIPLPEVLGEILGRGPATKGVVSHYVKLIQMFGSEFTLLFDTSIDEIGKRHSDILAEAVRRIRTGQVIRQPGYDGEFGVITVFSKDEIASLQGQDALFAMDRPKDVPMQKDAGTPDLFAARQKAAKRQEKTELFLNPEQEAAVNSVAPLLVITAGPGTGKTQTLIARLVRILTRDAVEPQRVTAITFTNRAAEEIRSRLAGTPGIEVENVFVGTFHGFCLHWLRQDNPQLTVAGNETREQILKKLYPGMTAAESKIFSNELSACFERIAADQSLEDAGDDGIDRAAVADYRAYLHGNNCIDLEEVVPYFVMQMRTDQRLRHEVLTAVSFLFVDEFQDLNAAQYELVTMLAGRARVFAIGDPDQAIYGFRGSRPEFFFRFVEEFGAEHLTLTKNYRSAPEILEAAAAVIGRNPSDLRRPQLALALKTGSIEYYAAGTDRDEADFVVQCIEEAMGGISHFSLNSGRGGEGGGQSSLAFSDIAVFYRLTQQAAELCTALQKRGIPFQVVGVPPFYMAPAVRAVYYWLRVADGQAEIEEHLALIRHLKGVGATTIRQLENQLLFADDDFFTAVTRIPLAPKTKGILNELKVLIGLFRNKVIKAGLAASLLEVFDWLRIEAELPEAGRLYELAGSFGDDLPGFSAYLKRNSQATVYDKEAESVSLMTMHAAKGLEFPMVFITGLEEDILPCTLLFGEGRPAEEAPDPVREERRLFFVALTRAEERLVLTSSAIRMVFGKKRGQQPSRFLAEIPTQLVTHRKRARKKRKKQQTAVQMKLF